MRRVKNVPAELQRDNIGARRQLPVRVMFAKHHKKVGGVIYKVVIRVYSNLSSTLRRIQRPQKQAKTTKCQYKNHD